VQGTGYRDVLAGHWEHWFWALGALEPLGTPMQGLG